MNEDPLAYSAALRDEAINGKKTKKKHSVMIVWGERVEEEQANSPYHYSFDTEAELVAFLQGVDAADGWLGATVFATDKEYEGWLKEYKRNNLLY